MDPLTEALRAEVRAAVGEALAAHRPVYALTVAQVAERLGCSDRAVGRLIADGHLEHVPHTRCITLGSLRRLVGLDELPVPGLAVVADEDMEAAS